MNEITEEKMGSIGGRKTSKKLLMCVSYLLMGWEI